ncbi:MULTISPECIES: hypothetical protein [unclassified Microbacterium]|uniref:hypothetical protein n=1 Tax=unclassified Microbacterium TaxID=2609290 RepID=UPI00214BC5D8|nr:MULTISPECIES: hypothetical protein [unclassified Microbacterium]MCR2808909.1 hypothetical protein [Microbacterium sp. zg.B185]WIM18672.1 hypothetical protein QNO12_13915 [Microbacterium sp. zg-B185]
MLKKVFTAAAVAGLLVLGGASAATAYSGSEEPAVVVADSTITVGQPITVTVTNLGDDIDSVYFTANGGALSSIVLAAVGPVIKPVTNGSASVTFTASEPGNYTVFARDADGFELGSVAISVSAVGSGAGGGTGGTGGGTGGSGGLPATGNELPAAALWLGVGAIGIGGIAIAAGVARRRAHTSN